METYNQRQDGQPAVAAPMAAPKDYAGYHSILSNRTDATKVDRSTVNSYAEAEPANEGGAYSFAI